MQSASPRMCRASSCAAWAGLVSLGLFALLMLSACDVVPDDPQPTGDSSVHSHESKSSRSARRAGSDAQSAPAAPAIDGSESELGEENEARAAPDADFDEDASTVQPIGEDEAQGEKDDSNSVADQEDSPPREPGNSPHRLDLQELFIDEAPAAERTVSPALDAALDRARAAMRERGYLEVRQELQAAAAYVTSGADRAAYEEMIRVYALWSQGWNEAGLAARNLRTGETLMTWAGPTRVEEVTESKIVLRLDEGPQPFVAATSEMDVRLAAALVIHRAAQTGLGLDAHAAALFVFDRDGTQEAARKACAEAAQRGAYIDPLIRELRRRK